MCCSCLISVSLQHELSPFRRASDNHVALLATWLIFAWAFVLLLRIVGLFGKDASLAVGTLLCIATVGVFVAAIVLANKDCLKQNSLENEIPPDKAATETSNDKNSVREAVKAQYSSDAETLEAERPPRGRPSPREDAVKPEDDATPPALPWSLLSMGKRNLCGAETAEDDAAPITTGATDFEELARLAIAAGVARSEVSRLAQAHLARSVAPPKEDALVVSK